MSKILIYF